MDSVAFVRHGWAGAMLRIGVAWTAVASGVVWAGISIRAAVWLDGVPDADYDAGNRFAFAWFGLMLAVGCCSLAAVTYAISRGSGWSVRRSFVAAEAAAISVAGACFLILI